jgi:8-oxo-dGTP diphosphatase
MWVYSIAFLEGEDMADAPFLMVRSRKRGGWEMPGGRLEKDEDPFAGAKREFREETGLYLEGSPDMSIPYQDGWVFFGRFSGDPHPTDPEIIEVKVFEKIPEDLAFPFVEYDELIRKGREVLLKTIS